MSVNNNKKLIIGDIEIKKYDYSDSVPTVIELSAELIDALDSIRIKCEEKGYTIDDYICSVLEYYINNPEERKKIIKQ